MRLFKTISARLGIILLLAATFALGALMARMESPAGGQDPEPVQPSVKSEALGTAPPTATPRAVAQAHTVLLASVTPTPLPSKTLKPPPTFEPSTSTPAPSLTPSTTPTSAALLEAEPPEGIHGLETPTPTSTQGCTPREDWKLTYEVQPDDALDRIAEKYGSNRWEMAEANCLTDPNAIYIGQTLRVPGDAHPYVPAVECIEWQALTPLNNTLEVGGEGNITFNWIGPRAPRNLIRVIKPSGEVWEKVIELRQNETVDLYEEFWEAGTYTWYVYPLDDGFRQVECIEGGPWYFTKAASPTATPTMTPTDKAPK